MPADVPRAAADHLDAPGPDDQAGATAHDPAAGGPGERSNDHPPAHLGGEDTEIDRNAVDAETTWPQPAHLAASGDSAPPDTEGSADTGLGARGPDGGVDVSNLGAPRGLSPTGPPEHDGSQTDVFSGDPWAPPTGAGTTTPVGAPGPEPATGEPPPAPVLPRSSPLPRALGALRQGVARRVDRAGRRGDGQPSPRRGLRVRQRLWSVDPWSVFKVSAVFYLCMLLVVLTAGTLLWNLGRSSGTIDDLENFVSRLAAYGECTPEGDVPEGATAEPDDDCGEGEVRVGGFELHDGTIFRATLFGGIVLAIAGSVGNVLMVVLLNLIGEITGGLRYTILREPEAGGASRPRRPPRSPAGARGR